MTVSLQALSIGAIVLDIEGTTTPVDFVYTVLFPYARTHVRTFLEREWGNPSCAEAVERLRQEQVAEADASAMVERCTTVDGVVAYVHWLMDRDRKSTGLKLLQGLVWRDGYQKGELHGIVYADVAPAFERWRASGLRLFIYSSGSVLAQQLLFGSTDAGDLTRLLDGFFDTGVGPKQSASSYQRIVDRIGVPASRVLFVSDVVAELDAARTAGMHTALCVRGPASDADSATHPSVHSFDEISDGRADSSAADR